MKWIAGIAVILLLRCWSVSAQPRNLRIFSVSDLPIGTTLPIPVIRGTNNPLSLPHLGVAAWWSPPDTNNWISEWSTNALEWNLTGNECGLGQWHYTETGTNWYFPNQWQVRIKRIQ